jgi:hypothetical protein
MNGIMRFFGHWHTVHLHRHRVLVHCIHAGIPWRGLVHDLSKYSPTEFINGVRYYQGDRSPNEAEREDIGYSRAWMHHKGRNRHHFEFWTDYNPVTKVQEPIEMPAVFVAEMFCDRMAASKTYLKEQYTDRSPLAYFAKAKNRRMIHPATSALLEQWLTILADSGEKAAFAEIRRYLKHDKQKSHHGKG